MLNTSSVWNGTSRLRFFITYSNDVDSGSAGQFVGPAGAAAWASLVGTWVAAMAHPRYLKVAGRPVFQVLIPSIFETVQCGGDASLANALIASLRAAGAAAGVGPVLVGGGWQVPAIPNASPTPPPRPAPQGYMQYTQTDVPCTSAAAAPCDLATLASVPSPGACEAACNATAGCTALVYYAANETCRLKAVAGPGAAGAGDTYVRVFAPLAWEWTGTYNDAQPVCPGDPNWECPQYRDSWWPNATPTGAEIFPYLQVRFAMGGGEDAESYEKGPCVFKRAFPTLSAPFALCAPTPLRRRSAPSTRRRRAGTTPTTSSPVSRGSSLPLLLPRL